MLTYAKYGNAAPSSIDEISAGTYAHGLGFKTYQVYQSISAIGAVEYKLSIKIDALTAQTNY